MTDKNSDDYKAGWYDGYQEAMKDRDFPKVYPTIPFPNNNISDTTKPWPEYLTVGSHGVLKPKK